MVRRGRTDRRRRTGVGTRTAGSAGQPAVPQLPWRQVENPHGTLPVLDPEGVETIHQASLRVLSELGIELWSEPARQALAQAGARVEGEIVYLDADLVSTALSTAPSSFTLTSRNPERTVTIGDNKLAFGLVSGPPAIHDRLGGRRSSNMDDYRNLTKLAHYFNAIHVIGSQVSSPVELPANNRHLDTYQANLVLSDLCFHAQAIGRGRTLDAIMMTAIARGLTPEHGSAGADLRAEMAARPGLATVINVNSPRRFDEHMADGLMTMAEYGQVVSVTPFTLMGAMTPATLAAGLTQQNAEALFGITLAQVIRPGTPVLYGSFTSNVDMRSGSPAFGTPEHAKANVASGQLARYYGLPYRCSNSNASNTVDAQAAYETQMSLWGAVLGGANLVYHAAGWMEGGLQASYEKLVIDVEMLQHMMEFLTPIDLNPDELAFDAMSRVPTGGHFFGDEHTLARYQDAFYQPMVSNWQTYDAWTEAGSADAAERATGIWQAALEDYTEPPMDPDARARLDDYVARRKVEIGDGEP